MGYRYAPLREGGGELGPVTEMLSWGFDFPPEAAEPWLKTGGLENVRVLSDGDKPIACLLLLPMGQYFGGARVPMVGIAGVATAPERRGTGAATALMREAVKELHALGAPISALYPATRPLYRRAGYEPAGSRLELTVPIARIGVKERGALMRPAEGGDHAVMKKLYREHAAARAGHLDRSEYIWRRVRGPRGFTARGFIVEEGGRVEGYVYLYERRGAGLFYNVHVTDIVTRGPSATRRLLGFLSDHGSNGRDLLFASGPSDPFAQALPEVGFELKGDDQWMLRVVDVKKALEARGYIGGLRAEIHLDITDELLPENAGRFVLSVEGGRGRVRRGGRGRLSLDVRGLAPLYTGHMHPAGLAAAGLLAGAPAEMQRATAIFAGPSPWMPDQF